MAPEFEQIGIEIANIWSKRVAAAEVEQALAARAP